VGDRHGWHEHFCMFYYLEGSGGQSTPVQVLNAPREGIVESEECIEFCCICISLKGETCCIHPQGALYTLWHSQIIFIVLLYITYQYLLVARAVLTRVEFS
jgi:hypothetical protein